VSQKFGWMFRLASLLFASALFIATITPSWALAQSTEDPWTEPVNLSHSGVAVNPAIVTDSEGIVHAVWQDDREKYMYSRFDGNKWSAPETTNLDLFFTWPGSITSETPLVIYTGPNPLFIANPYQHIFAFWLSPQGGLFASKAENEDFKSWDYVRLIASGAASFAAAVDALGEWHLAYLRTVADPTHPVGIYYTHSKNGQSWDVPVLLYESSYLHRLGEGEANLSVATAGREDSLRVYVAWDNRPRKQVLLAQSADGGESWEQPKLIAGPVQDSGSATPFNIRVGAYENNVVLLWQSGQLGGTCSQFYQSSKDAGVTWSDPEPMLKELSGCALSNGFVTTLAKSPEDPMYLLTEMTNQVFLSAWNGRQWSQAQVQSVLSGFEEPEIYTEVIFGCRQASLLGERLYIVGCDEGQGGDVWITSRDMGSNTFQGNAPEWSELSPVTNDDLEMESIELVTTDDGLIHAFFSQHQDPAIYYVNWDGASWSRISPVLKLPDGEAGSPAIAAGPGNQLFLIAPNNRGALYFSRAISGGAVLASSWSTPARLKMGPDGEIGSVDVTWDAAGTVYVVYSVPVNEERGIYLVLSKDQGTTWSEPLQVFDAAAVGLDFVGAPSLLTSADGVLNVTWTVQSIAGNGVPQPLSLYYARSEDDGQTFNKAEPVVEEPVAWREIVTDGKGNLHILWQPQELTTVWDQVSSDGGDTWQHPQGLPDAGRLAAVTSDPDGRLQLVTVRGSSLGHWIWDRGQWQSETPPSWSLSSRQETQVEMLAATINKQGKLVVVLRKPIGEAVAGEWALLYTTRALELSTKQSTTQASPTQTLLPPTLTPATATDEPTSTPASTIGSELSTSQDSMDSSETNNRFSPFTIALLPVALLLLSILGIALRQAARAKDRW
jgi:hypothetical protein